MRRAKSKGRADPKIFFCIPASAADAATVNPKGIKTLLANGLITFFIRGNPVLKNRPKSLPRNPPDCIIFDNWVFDNLMSVNVFSAKSLRILATCLLVNNNSLGKFHFISSVSFFIDDFSLLSCEFDSFTFKLLY